MNAALFDDAGDAAAAALARRRVAAVALLGLSIPAFGPQWAAGAAFVAAALVAGERFPEARGRALAAGVVGCAAAAVLRGTPDFAPGALTCAAASAALLGARPRSWGLRAAAAALVGTLWIPRLWDVGDRGTASRVLVTGVFLLLVCAGRPVGRMLVVAAAALAVWAAHDASPSAAAALSAALGAKTALERVGGIVRLAEAAVPAFAALAAGVVGHAVARKSTREADSRWVVAVHRSPWKTSAAVTLAALLVEAAALARADCDPARAVLLGMVPAGVLLGAQSRVATNPFDALAPFAAATTLTCVSVAALDALSNEPLFAGRGLVVGSAAVLWSFGVCRFFDAHRANAALPMWIWPALVVVACALAASDADAVLPLTALALVPFVAQYVVAAARPTREIVQGAALLGVVASVALAVAEESRPVPVFRMMLSTPLHPADTPAWWWPFWLCAGVGLAAVVARRIRGLTMVPAHHASFEWRRV